MAIERNTGYRDPHKALTLKALQDRQKAAAAAFAGSGGMDQISTPFAGAANMLDVLGANRAQRHADEAEGSARAQLAQIMSGVKPQGATTEQLAQIGTYDPELAKALREELERKLTLEDTQQQQTSERLGSQDFTAGESQLTREQQTKLQEDTQAEARTTAETLAKTQAEKARLDASLSSDEAKVRAELAAGGIDQTEADRRLNEISRQKEAQYQSTKPDIIDAPRKGTELGMTGPEGEKYYKKNVDTGDLEPLNTGASTEIKNIIGGEDKFFGKSGELAAARMDEIIKEGQAAPAFLSDIKRLGDLGKTIGTGKEEEFRVALGPWAEMVGVDITGLGEAQAYKAITDRLAPQMRPSGSGSTSNYDAQQFLSSLPNLGRSPDGNRIIEETFKALHQHKINSAEIARRAQRGEISWQDAEQQIAALPYPYELFNQATGSPSVGGGTGEGSGGDPLGLGAAGAGGGDPNDPLGLLKQKP